jgi:hypothetical protein
MPAPTGFHPGPASVNGRVARIDNGIVVIDAAGNETAVRVDQGIEIWKETVVPATSLEVGDDLFVNGTAGSPFIASYVWANIGRIDGVVRDIDQNGMSVETSLRSGGHAIRRVDFSRYVEYGTADGGITLTRADLIVGRAISAVVYVPRGGAPLRATRIW